MSAFDRILERYLSILATNKAPWIPPWGIFRFLFWEPICIGAA